MAAATTDLLLKVGTPGTATTLAAPGYTIGAASITVVSTTNWPTDTLVAFAIDTAKVVNGEEERIAGTYNEFVGIVTGATTIASLTKTYGTAQNYAAGALTRVYIPVSSTRENKIVEWGIVEHSQTGVHALTSNSTLTSSKFITALNDTNGNELFKVTATGSAVNEFTVANAATGGNPTLSATGGDANITMRLSGKGTGGIWIDQYQPYKFSAYRNAAANTGNAAYAKVVFDTETYDTNSNFATGTYTAPVAGFYHFSSWLKFAVNGQYNIALYKNGSIIKEGASGFTGSNTTIGEGVTADLSLAANDTIDVYVLGNGGALSVGSAANCYFDGHLISRT